jgi:hypothetical protein
MENVMDTLVLFDLELTLFDAWDSFVPMNERSVSLFVSQLPEDAQFGLYSWAVYGQEDKDHFVSEEQEWVERMFGFTFDAEYLYTLDDMMGMVHSVTKDDPLTRKQFFDRYNKESSMSELLNHPAFKNKHLYLVDDTVTNKEVFNKANNCRVTFVQVNDLPSY